VCLQAEANKSLYREVASSACIIKGTDSRKLMVRLDSEGYLRGVPSTADNLLNLRHWFLDSKGAILARLPMQVSLTHCVRGTRPCALRPVKWGPF